MELILIRHAEPEWVRDGLNVVNPPLTERGLRQAELLADSLRQQRFDEVLVSPLLRARQTAAPLLDALGMEERIEPWLEEIREPDWHGTPAEFAAEAYRREKARSAEERWHGLERGEPPRQFADRIHAGCSAFLAARGVYRSEQRLPVFAMSNAAQRIALVAHAGTNSVTIAHLLGFDPTPWEWDRFVIGHASVSRVEAYELGDGYSFSLAKLSDVEHLAPADRTQ